MNSEEIKNTRSEGKILRVSEDADTTVAYESTMWLKEIAFQLAVANEREAERDKQINKAIEEINL